jgi:monofunctional chorismate mutase
MGERKLEELRADINEIDEKMIGLFKDRMLVVKEIARYKMENGMQVLDESREQFIIKKHTDDVKDPDLSREIGEFIKGMLRISRDAQNAVISSYKR